MSDLFATKPTSHTLQTLVTILEDQKRRGNKRTLRDLVVLMEMKDIQISEAGLSARLRELRKPQNGAYRIEKKQIRKGSRQFVYWLA